MKKWKNVIFDKDIPDVCHIVFFHSTNKGEDNATYGGGY